MDLTNWTPPLRPPHDVIRGRYVTLEPLTLEHVPGLWEAQSDPETWRYIPVGPFESEAAFSDWVADVSASEDPLQFAVRMADGRLGGTMSLMRITPAAGTDAPTALRPATAPSPRSYSRTESPSAPSPTRR